MKRSRSGLRHLLFGDPDATIRVRRGRARSGRVVVGAVACVVVAAAGIWIAVLPHGAHEVARPELPAAQSTTAELPAADEPVILATQVSGTTLFRFAPGPRIIVALFPSMHAQAVTLNRVAVFIEFGEAPRTLVLDDAALRRTIAEGGQGFDNFYYGHDYRAADLARFFATADADGVVLNDEERALRAELARLAHSPTGYGALISLPPAGTGPQDPPGRTAILRHELSHGLYFTDAAYAQATALFWLNVLGADERAGFRRFLGGNGYDATNDDLMRNEAQAYLVHTRDKRFFYPAAAGLTPERAASLRAMFVAAMPPGWLHDRTPP